MKPAFDDIFMDLAVHLAKRSHCIKAQVGAVLTKDTRIISIGYNGPPAYRRHPILANISVKIGMQPHHSAELNPQR